MQTQAQAHESLAAKGFKRVAFEGASRLGIYGRNKPNGKPDEVETLYVIGFAHSGRALIAKSIDPKDL